MRPTYRYAAATSLVVALVVGCSGQESPQVRQGAEVRLDKAKLDEVMAYIKKQKGKVVVVDLWNYLCGPCKVEFPNLVKLHKKYGDKVVCVSVSAGLDPEKYYDKSLAFLKKQGATFHNFMLNEDAEWEKAFKVATGAVPAVIVYDQKGEPVFEYRDAAYYRKGKEEKTEEEPRPYDHVGKVVEKLIGP